MYGRTVNEITTKAFRPVVRRLDVRGLPPRHNIAPTRRLTIVGEEQERRFSICGFFPFNARRDTMLTRPSFHSAFERRRCLFAEPSATG